jgi:hypothetical protein
LDEADILFGWAVNTAGKRKLGDASATTVQSIPDSPDISLNDVSFTSMTVHMETVYAEDKNVTGSTFPGFRTTVPWIARMLECVSRDWTKLQHILSLAGTKSAGISENSADASATTVQNIPILPIFRSTTCPSLP